LSPSPPLVDGVTARADPPYFLFFFFVAFFFMDALTPFP